MREAPAISLQNVNAGGGINIIEKLIVTAVSGEQLVESGPAKTRLDAILYTDAGVVGKPEKFFGHEELLARVTHGLEAAKKILISGFGGIGKTALATTVVEQWLLRDKGAVIWLQCGAETAKAQFEALGKVAGRTGHTSAEQAIRASSGLAQAKAVSDWLGQSNIALIVLDDARNGAALQEVLKAIPRSLAVLVTSRQHFPMDAVDQILEMTDLPPADALDVLGHYSGGRDFHADAVAQELCQVLGCHAYALEIAGKTLKVYGRTPSQLLKRIRSAPDAVSMPAGFAAEGRESVKALLDDSFNSLDKTVQEVLLIFGALYTSGATPELLAACMGRNVSEVEAALDNLMVCSLTRCRGEGNYWFVHDLTFSYAHARYATSTHTYPPTVEAIREYVLLRAQDFDLLELDLPNILAAAAHAPDETLISIMAVLAMGGYPDGKSQNYMDARGHTQELLSRLDDAIAAARQIGTEQRAILHFLLGKRGNAYIDHGDFKTAITLYQEALACAPTTGRRVVLLAVIGKALTMDNEHTAAEEYFGRAAELANSAGDNRGLAFVLQQRSYAAWYRKDHEAARAVAAEAVDVWRKIGDPFRIAIALLNLGTTEFELVMKNVLKLHSEAFGIAQTVDRHDFLAAVRYTLGKDYHAMGDRDQAQAHLAKALSGYHEIGSTVQESEVRKFMEQFGYFNDQ